MDSDLEILKKLANPTVTSYLEFMDETETPPLFHAFSLVSAASACLTRRKWFDMGPIRVVPNQYMMLVGAPGVRKSEGIKFAKRLLEDIPALRLAPNNTAGKLQGLISAMIGNRKVKDPEDAAFMEAINASFNESQVDEDLVETHVLNRHALYVAEGELVSFLGQNQDAFISFLGDMWDKSGDAAYQYTLKKETVRVENPCLNILGAITPMHITSYIPPQAIGQGFTSRVIMVYADSSKKIPWPEELDAHKLRQFKNLMKYIFDMPEGAFSYTSEAKEAIKTLYFYKMEIEDIRFLHYGQRRQQHLIKIAMALAALRMTDEVDDCDVYDAHQMLVLAESRMSQALGEYGLSPYALAKSRVTAVLKHSREPLTLNRIFMAVGSDVNRTELGRVIHDMQQANLIVELNLEDSSGARRRGFAWPREDNPFKQFANVKVEYGLEDNPQAITSNRAKQTAEKAAALLGTRQESQLDELDDYSSPNSPNEEHGINAEEALSLTAQGFNSVAEKLQSLIDQRRSKLNGQ